MARRNNQSAGNKHRRPGRHSRVVQALVIVLSLLIVVGVGGAVYLNHRIGGDAPQTVDSEASLQRVSAGATGAAAVPVESVGTLSGDDQTASSGSGANGSGSNSSSGSGGGGTSAVSGGAYAEAAENASQAVQNSEFYDRAAAMAENMSLEEKIAQLIIVTPETLAGLSDDYVTVCGSVTEDALQSLKVGGVIYTQNNYESNRQFTYMTQNIQDASDTPLFLLVENNGGSGDMDTTENGPLSDISSTDEAEEFGSTLGSELMLMGINFDLSPVVATDDGDNSFSSDADTVAGLAQAATSGFEESGILNALTYFPSSGSTSDTEGAAEIISGAVESGADAVMMGGIVQNDDGTETPAMFSGETVMGTLRGNAGFTGLILSGYLNNDSITGTYSSADAAVQALLAGNDMLLCPANPTEAVQGISDAVAAGNLTEDEITEHTIRVLEAKLSAGIMSGSSSRTSSSNSASGSTSSSD